MYMDVTIRPICDQDYDAVVSLSQKWEHEQITYGVVASARDDLQQMDIWVCEHNGQIIGYLSGSAKKSDGMCVFPSNADYYEVDELYVDASWRSHGIGGQLYKHVENELKQRGVQYMLLRSATKDYRRISDFYISQGFNMWTMTFYKHL